MGDKFHLVVVFFMATPGNKYRLLEDLESGTRRRIKTSKRAKFHKRKLWFNLIELDEQYKYRFCVILVMDRRTGLLELQYSAAIG